MNLKLSLNTPKYTSSDTCTSRPGSADSTVPPPLWNLCPMGLSSGLNDTVVATCPLQNNMASVTWDVAFVAELKAN